MGILSSIGLRLEVNPRVDQIEHFRCLQQIVSTKAGRFLPDVAVAIQPYKRHGVPLTGPRITVPH